MERLVVCLYTLLMFLFAVALGVAILYHCYKLSDCLRVHARCRRAGLSLLPHFMCFQPGNEGGGTYNSSRRGPLTRLDSDLENVQVPPPWTVSGQKNCCDGIIGQSTTRCACTFTVSPVLRFDGDISLTMPGQPQPVDLLGPEQFHPGIYGLQLPPPTYAEAVRSAK